MWRSAPYALACLLCAAAGCNESAPPPSPDTQADVAADTSGEVAGVYEGQATLIDRYSTNAFAEIGAIIGDVVISSPESITFDVVRSIHGTIRLGGTEEAPATANLAFLSLVELVGSLEVARTAPAGIIDLARLEQVSGDITLAHGDWYLFAPRLTSIGGDLRVRDGGLVALYAPLLDTVGGDVVIERVDVRQEALSLPRLTTVGGSLEISDVTGLQHLGLPALTTVGMDRLPLGDLIVEGNADLRTLDVHALVRVGGALRVVDNAKYAADTLQQSVGETLLVGTSTICGNLGDATCE